MAKVRVRHHVNPLSDLGEISFDGFGNDRPVIVDIGADRGEFVEGLLDKFGDRYNFIAFEIRKPLAKKLAAKFSKFDNVRVFDGDAVRNFNEVVGRCASKDNAPIAEIYINFPDPWFKDRHHKRRVLGERLVETVRPWISPETIWIFQTDQEELFDQTTELLHSLQISNTALFDEPPHGVSTKWEVDKISRGFKIRRMRFTIEK